MAGRDSGTESEASVSDIDADKEPESPDPTYEAPRRVNKRVHAALPRRASLRQRQARAEVSDADAPPSKFCPARSLDRKSVV